MFCYFLFIYYFTDFISHLCILLEHARIFLALDSIVIFFIVITLVECSYVNNPFFKNAIVCLLLS